MFASPMLNGPEAHQPMAERVVAQATPTYTLSLFNDLPQSLELASTPGCDPPS